MGYHWGIVIFKFKQGWLSALLCLSLAFAAAQDVTVTGRVTVSAPGGTELRDQSNVVVWLTPVSASPHLPQPNRDDKNAPRLVQKNKSFQPHVLVVPVGAAVEFPNLDPWFHNVFSLFDGKRFDLGLYEAGDSRAVHFDREGISYIFCNIHPEMSAVVIALGTPYYSVSDRAGNFNLTQVPPGRYLLHVWSERAQPETLQAASREVTISERARSLGEIRFAANSMPLPAAHKNKYGRDYDQHPSYDSIYREP